MMLRSLLKLGLLLKMVMEEDKPEKEVRVVVPKVHVVELLPLEVLGLEGVGVKAGIGVGGFHQPLSS